MAKKQLKPRRGAIAYCKKGDLGLILADEPKPRKGWRGINMMTGGEWWSKEPNVVGLMHSKEAINDMEQNCDFQRCREPSWY